MQKIKEIEKLIIETKVNMVTSEYFCNLLHIHSDLCSYLNFKVNLEKDWLKPKEEEGE